MEKETQAKMPEEDAADGAPLLDADTIAEKSRKELNAKVALLLAKGLGKEGVDKITYDTDARRRQQRIKMALIILAILVIAALLFFKARK
tara:strand:- start:380 stop:649 length:270 start_codon:yes stop_codon:yes gene_type:complete